VVTTEGDDPDDLLDGFDPVLPLRRRVAGDEQPEAIKDELDEDESTWTSLDKVE
jgi:hypothetical protein